MKNSFLSLLIVVFCCFFLKSAYSTNGLDIDDTALANKVFFKIRTVNFLSERGRISLSLWLALTPEEKEMGLMFRRKMDKAVGMLFVFDSEDIIAMWMKNTYMPLDMVFFDENGRVVNIKYDAVPESLDIISSKLPAKFVLELPAGKAVDYGFTYGSLLLDTKVSEYLPK